MSWTESPREGLPHAVRSQDINTELDLTKAGRCNWLTEYGNSSELEYCGAPVAGLRLCAEHRAEQLETYGYTLEEGGAARIEGDEE